MVFDGLGEVRPVIEESCNFGVVLCEYLDDCWQTEYSWGGLITESLNVGFTGITGDYNPLLSHWLSLQLKHQLSLGVSCKDMDDCWQTEDRWGGLMTESFNGGGTGIISDEN